MKDGDIDYSNYTHRELEEAISGINKSVYPKNYANLKEAYNLAFGDTDNTISHNVNAVQEDSAQIRYAGFWLRFVAMWIDLFVLIPVAVITYYFVSEYRLFHLYSIIPSLLFSIWFNIYLVYRYGGTPGKLILGMRIAMVDGSSVTLKGAILRHIVLIVLSTIQSIGEAIASLKITDAQYLSTELLKKPEVLATYAPAWYHIVSLLITLWVWSEFITMLFNKKRRAIHDYMAGTVVVINAKET